MHHALRVSRQAWPACRPELPAGCVLVKEGRVVASGYNQPPGQPHAEVMALSRFAGNLSEVTAYLTLEPSASHNQRPSGANILAASGIKRVMVATLNPDPRLAGVGVDVLRTAGIEVVIGVLEQQVLKEIAASLENSGRPS